MFPLLQFQSRAQIHRQLQLQSLQQQIQIHGCAAGLVIHNPQIQPVLLPAYIQPVDPPLQQQCFILRQSHLQSGQPFPHGKGNLRPFRVKTSPADLLLKNPDRPAQDPADPLNLPGAAAAAVENGVAVVPGNLFQRLICQTLPEFIRKFPPGQSPLFQFPGKTLQRLVNDRSHIRGSEFIADPFLKVQPVPQKMGAGAGRKQLQPCGGIGQHLSVKSPGCRPADAAGMIFEKSSLQQQGTLPFSLRILSVPVIQGAESRILPSLQNTVQSLQKPLLNARGSFQSPGLMLLCCQIPDFQRRKQAENHSCQIGRQQGLAAGICFAEGEKQAFRGLGET